MSVKTDTELKAAATVIANETAVGANTKSRVATLFTNIVDSKVSLKFWDFSAHSDAFPTSDAATIYLVINGDHGSPGDVDYTPNNSFMICDAAGASTYADYVIKP